LNATAYDTQKLDARESEPMTIVISLSPEVEARLREKAARQGQDVSLVAAELLTSVLEWEAQDSEEAIEGIQRGWDDFEVGRFRSFHKFAEEQRH
jgi:predicted transcriptional regulator